MLPTLPDCPLFEDRLYFIAIVLGDTALFAWNLEFILTLVLDYLSIYIKEPLFSYLNSRSIREPIFFLYLYTESIFFKFADGPLKEIGIRF